MIILLLGFCIEGSFVGEIDNCVIYNDNRFSDIIDSENRFYSELLGKKEFIGLFEGCCFKLCEDVSDLESWRYEGNRGDIRFSLDLDFFKSERIENFLFVLEMGRIKIIDIFLDLVLSLNIDEDNFELIEGLKCFSVVLISNIDYCYVGFIFVLQLEERNEENIDSFLLEDGFKNGINLKDFFRNYKNIINGFVDKGFLSDIN